MDTKVFPFANKTVAELVSEGSVDELLSAVLLAYRVKEDLSEAVGGDAEELYHSGIINAAQMTWLGSFIDLWDATMVIDSDACQTCGSYDDCDCIGAVDETAHYRCES